MIDDVRPWHCIKPGKLTRVPRKHIFLDTETRRTRVGGGSVQTLRVAVACHVTTPKNRVGVETWHTYTSTARLWLDVDAFSSGRDRTVLWAHNLSFDVRIADCFTVLPKRGWKLEAHNLNNRGTWLQWRKGEASLLMVDSVSTLPMSIEDMAKSFEHAKLPLPDDDDNMSSWVARCRRDVQILKDGVLAYLAWIERDGLGNWQMTGAGQAFTAFRTKHLTHRLVVHGDRNALDAERRAMWTGRCEAYWKGNTGSVGVDEWDLSLSYIRQAMASDLPIRFMAQRGPVGSVERLPIRASCAILADVQISTNVPIAPVAHDGRVVWPVGQFETTLWSPELILASEFGDKVTVRRWWLYESAPCLRSFGEWIVKALDDRNGELPAWQRSVLKHWSRAIIGRFGMRYTQWDDYGQSPDLNVRASTLYDRETGRIAQLSQVGSQALVSNGEVEWSNSMPAITGYVMSAVRARLWRMFMKLPSQCVLYCDTDSLITLSTYRDTMARLAKTPLGAGLRLKNGYSRATILGPRQLVLDRQVKFAGIPKRAQRCPDGSIRGEVWQSLQASLAHGAPGCVRTVDRVWHPKGTDRRRLGGFGQWSKPLSLK